MKKDHTVNINDSKSKISSEDSNDSNKDFDIEILENNSIQLMHQF